MNKEKLDIKHLHDLFQELSENYRPVACKPSSSSLVGQPWRLPTINKESPEMSMQSANSLLRYATSQKTSLTGITSKRTCRGGSIPGVFH